MASFAFSSVIFTQKCPLFSQTKVSSFSCSNKTNFSSSKSSFLQYGFSLPTSKYSLNSKLIKGTIYARAATGKTLYDYSVKDIDGKDVPLGTFKGKVLLIVNVASRCGLTTSNYTELSHLYEKYKSQGLEILAFPCNQFGAQEPGSNPEIKQFACTRFKAEFPIFDKVEVNGPNTAPVYQFLKSSAGGFLGDLVKWNFEKFLVDKNGKVVERYPPTTSPFQIERNRKDVSLINEYKGKILLIVNIPAQGSQWTNSEYKLLHELYEKYKDREFEILGFLYDKKETGEQGYGGGSEEINTAKFPLFDTVQLNDQHKKWLWGIDQKKRDKDLWYFLKHVAPGGGEDVKEEFEKFLVDWQGIPLGRYPRFPEVKTSEDAQPGGKPSDIPGWKDPRYPLENEIEKFFL